MASDTQRMQMDHQLIDDGLFPERYVTGRLEPEERTRFEMHFVDCPFCLDRIEAAEALATGLKNASAVPAPVAPARKYRSPAGWALRTRWALAGACAAALLAGLWANTSRRRWEEDVASARRMRSEALSDGAAARAQLERERTPRKEAEARLEAQTRPPVRVPVLALVAMRGSDAPTLELPEKAQPVVLSVERETPPRFARYFVTVHSETGGDVWQGGIQPSSRDAVVLALDSSHFLLGKYVLSLEGVDPSGHKVLLGQYSFRTVATAKQ